MHTPISSLNPLNWTIWLLHIALNCTILKCFAKSVVINKKNTMPWKADKPTQNSALQGISEQENFMIKVLFICHGRIRTFVWSGLKSRLLGNENGICTSPLSPLFCASVPRQPKSKAFGLEFVNRTVLDKNEYDLWWKKFLRGWEKCWQSLLSRCHWSWNEKRFWHMIFYVAYSAEARQDLRDIYEYIAYELLVPETVAGQWLHFSER